MACHTSTDFNRIAARWSASSPASYLRNGSRGQAQSRQRVLWPGLVVAYFTLVCLTLHRLTVFYTADVPM